ncbi:DUF2279 domain-containing protein [Spirosoma oryzicola]|uniref:DUF2279 domain-containing protein n=1 Tax=Spirosoma oryzicola TaxID=2898794 RepID=UPI001E3771F0|nr:DUF2279 domain-containing protein [Spirosoma oryzicola]UHG91338.1 YfiM family protein [Spirosoma oryzicola]
MKTLFLVLALTSSSDTLPVSSDSSRIQSSTTKAGRVWAVGATSLLTLGSSYAYLERTWWNGKGTAFHFDEGRDLTYASGLDKVAHLVGGVFVSDAYYNAFRWAGVAPRKAQWLALGAAAFVEVGIELKDAYSPTYGFSWRDVTAGTLGGFWPMLQHRSAFLQDAQWKASYWQRTPKYFDERGIPRQRFSIDDYLNQTYWLSFSVNRFGGQRWQNTWPDWLQLSVGMGLEAESWSSHHDGLGGRHEWYIAPDINLIKLFKPRNATAKLILGFFKYIKIPAPTLQIGPKLRWYWFYF